MKEIINIFGSALDPLDGQEKVNMKRAYLTALSNGIEISPDYRDLYDAITCLNPRFADQPFRKVGKVPVDTWLTPKPLVGDLYSITSERYRAFLEENGCRKYADATGDYLNSILPARFLMLGVDHSQTGGVVRKLAEYYGPDQITVIVLDAHSDMFDFDLLYQAQIRLMELEMPFYLPSLPETTGYNNTFYGCGNFLKNLMDENAILPQNLFLIGVTDYPAGLPENEDDPAIKRYIESYMDRVQQGVRVFSKREVESSQDQMASALKSITTPYVYISVDMDVGAFAASSAVRFPNTFGMSEDLIYRTVAAIRQAIDSSNNCCVGLDIMEIDVHFAGYPSRGVDDRAYIIASNIINILWP